MNLILLFQDDFIGDSNRVLLRGRRLEHIRSVQRPRAGDRLTVGLLNSRIGSGLITSTRDDAVELEVELDRAPPTPLPVTLLLALPRPKSLKRIVQAATAMGVKRIVLMSTWRVEKSFWSSPVLRPDALRHEMILGLEQARDTTLPEITLRRRFKPFVEDELPQIVRDTRALVAHPEAAKDCPRGVRAAVTLAVGPEGGFIPYEVDMLRSRGFEAVSLGERRLRVEHAVPALLARIF